MRMKWSHWSEIVTAQTVAHIQHNPWTCWPAGLGPKETMLTMIDKTKETFLLAEHSTPWFWKPSLLLAIIFMRLNACCLLELPVIVRLQQRAVDVGPARQHPVSKEHTSRLPPSTLLWPIQTTEKSPQKNKKQNKTKKRSPVAHCQIKILENVLCVRWR